MAENGNGENVNVSLPKAWVDGLGKLGKRGALIVLGVIVAGPGAIGRIGNEASAWIGIQAPQERALEQATVAVDSRLSSLEQRFDDPTIWQTQKAQIGIVCGEQVAQILDARAYQILPAPVEPPPTPRPNGS